MSRPRTSTYDELSDFLTSRPTLTQLIKFRFSDQFRRRFRYLLEANRQRALTADEQKEAAKFQWLDNLVIDLKIRARQRLAETTPTISNSAGIFHTEMVEFLTSQPNLYEIAQIHASEAAQERLRHLLDANRNCTLTDAERLEFDDLDHLEHFMRWVKIRALQKLTENI